MLSELLSSKHFILFIALWSSETAYRSKVERVRGDRAVIADTTNLGILLLGGCLAALSMASCGSRY